MPDSQNRLNLSNGMKAVLFLLILMISAGPLSAGDRTNEYRFNLNYIKRFGRDAVSVFSSPAHWKGKDFLTLSAVVGAGALLFSFDQPIKEWVEMESVGIFDNLWTSITNMGNGLFVGGLLAGYYIAGEVFQRDSMRKIALLGVESYIISGVLVGLMKVTFGRARPYTEESQFSFHPFSSKASYYSFPSGHAASAFSVAAVIAEYSKEFLVDLTAYGLATLVAMSRVNKNKHWASDVFIGSAIGYFIGKKISNLNRDDQPGQLAFGFQFGDRRKVFSLCYSF